jgi:carboxyl-terminal processing protease
VIRFALLFALLLIAPAYAETPLTHTLLAQNTPDLFDQRLAADVFSTALVFMAPRILDPVSIPQLVLWGLRGLSALDPTLSCDLRDGVLTLSANDHVVTSLAAPGIEDSPGWADTAASLAAAAWDVSPAMRRAGTSGVIRYFFDELFNHLDPYSRYAPPAEAEDNRDRRSGSGGVGITVVLSGGAMVVQQVVNESPAAEAGIHPGDRLIAIDGTPLGRRDATRLEALLSGPEGTDVSLTVRARDRRLATYALQRALVAPETVFPARVADMLILRVTGFSRDTDKRVAHELARAMTGTPAPHGVVFDLRGNRGGLLRQAVAAASLVLDGGLVATTAGRDPDANHVWRAEGTDETAGLPIVVVVDGRSASAAEIVAAALSDDRRAVVVGSSTLGKGLVQTITSLPDGGELLVTWSRVLAPLGWPLQGLGVLPQVCTSLGQDALDRQLAALRQGQQLMERELARHRTARAPMPLAQILDIRNACPAAIGRDVDLETAHFLIDTPAAYATALLNHRN